MTRRILHIDLDAFFVSVEQALEPSLKGKPVIVGGEIGERGVVASASYEARRYGIRSGMPLSKARKLCPDAICLPGSFDRYRDASTKFMAILSDYSPDLEPVSLDEAYLDLTGFETIYGPATETARAIKERIARELGLPSSVGIASSKVVAKVAAERSKPDGLLEVSPGQEGAFLAPLPVRELPMVGPKTEKVLLTLGVTTIGELAATDPATLQVFFGSFAALLHRFANGIDDSPVQPPEAAKSVSRETTFAQDTLDMDFLQGVLRYLSERVGAELRRMSKQARVVTLKLRYYDFLTIARSRTLPQPTDAHQAIFDAGQAMLAKALSERRKLVRLIGIGASNFVGPERQLTLLDPFPGRAQRLARLNRALDILRDKYGFTSIETGGTFQLSRYLKRRRDAYLLHTPSLSR